MAGEYDAILDEEQGRTPGTPSGAYDTVLDQEVQQQQQIARTVFEKALAVNPDQAAQSKKLMNTSGLPLRVIERNLDEVKRKEQARQLDMAQMVQDSPVLARQLTDPSFTNQAHDDVSTLGGVERFLRDTGGSVKAGLFNASKGSAGVFRAGLELVAPVLDPLESLTAIGGNPLRRLAEGFALQAENAGATAKAAAPQTDGVLSGGFQSGVQSLTQNLLSLPVAFLPGGQSAALASMVSMTGGQSYQDAREKGLSMSQALPFAASQAAIEYATEKLPLEHLIGGIKAGAPFLQTLAKQMALEIPGEQIATIMQDLNEWAILNPEKTFRSYLDERPNAAAQTLIATIVGTGGNVVVSKGIESATKKLMGDAYDAGQADTGAEQLKNALALATESKLRERNPDEFRSLVQKMAEGTEGAPTEVFVDAEVLNQMAPEVLAQLPGVAAQMQAALAANDVVSIPMSDVLTVAPGTPMEAMLVEHARIGDPSAMSQFDAKEAGAKAQEYLTQESARVIQQATDQRAMQESSDRVRQSMLDQLNTVGRFRKDVNEAYATWTAAFYTTMGGRLGLTPEQMQAKYPLKITGQGGVGELTQGVDQSAAYADAVATGNKRAALRILHEALGIKDADFSVDRGGAHSPSGPEDGSPLYDVSRGGTYPEDVYSHNGLKYYSTGEDAMDREAYDHIERVEGRPNAPITVYRAVAKSEGNKIEPGAWVTTVRAYAKDHGEGALNGDYKIVKATVSARDIFTSGDSWLEWGYHPQKFRPEVPKGSRTNTPLADRIAAHGGMDSQVHNAYEQARQPDTVAPVSRHPGETPLYEAMRQLSRFEESFKGGTSDATDLAQIATDFTAGREDVAQFAAEKSTALHQGNRKPTLALKVTTKGGNEVKLLDIFNAESDRPFVVIGNSEAGQDVGGAMAYQVAFAWAHNNGKVMRPDPAGLTVINRLRRTEAMISSAMRFGTTEHLEPHQDQYVALLQRVKETKQEPEDTHYSGRPDIFAELEQIKGALWSAAKDPVSIALNVQHLLEASSELAALREPSIRTLEVADGVLRVRDGSEGGVRLEDVPVDENAGEVNVLGVVLKPASSGVGPSTLLRATVAASVTRRVQEQSTASNAQDGGNQSADVAALQAIRQVLGRLDSAAPSQLEGIFYQGPRGTFSPKSLELALNENADLSTFLHETGHFFLEVMSDLANQPDAPAGIQTDMGKLMEWFGVADLATWNAMTLDQKRPYHERFAESFEQYLLEGKSPSLELQPLFRKFRAWMLNVYKSLKAFIDSRVAVTSGGEGLAQMPAPIESEAFKAWFGDSKVADAQGKPLVVYHGTAGDFDTFKKTSGGEFGPAMYFTDNPREAGEYGAGQQKPGVNVLPVYISMWHPYTEGVDKFWQDFGKDDGDATAIERAQNAGYDGVIANRDDVYYDNAARKFVNTGKKLTHYIVFNPTQIKSATGNNGEYDPSNPNILKQGGQPAGPNIQLSDEVRQVFDRMLASEEQIAQANEVAGLLPAQDADAEANEKLTARSLRDLKWTVNARAKAIKALQAQAKELRKGVQAEVTAEVNQMPEFQAKEMLDKTRKENKEQLNDTELAIVADTFGYADVPTMLQAIDAAGKKSDVIEGMTDQRMLERHGDLIDQRAIEAAANEAVHNEARARSLATELRSQAEMMNPRTDTGQTTTNGSKITVNAIVEAAKQFAANVVATTPLRDLKGKAWQHTAAERRAGKRWQEATAAGKTQEAVKAKQDQVLNNAAAKAAMEAQTEMRKVLDFFKRVIKDNNEKTVDKGRDPDVVNAARAVLAAYGVAPKAGKTALEYLALVEKNDPAMFAALAPSVQGALNLAQPLDALTMEELRGLHEEIQAMWHLAKRSRQMEVDGNMMDLQDAEDELQARMQAIGVPTTMPGDTGAITTREKAGRALQFAGSLLRRAEQWAEGMDGKFGGPFLRLVFQPVKDAADAYRTDRVTYRKAYQALVDAVAPSLTKGMIAAPEIGYTFGKGHNGIGHAELLHAILHTGNDSNKRKLLLGRGWATENSDGTLDTGKWDAFISRMYSEGKLNKAHYDFAQGVWDLLEKTKPLAQKTHRDVFGRYFAEVTANPFSTPFGDYAGGYVPAQADPEIVQDASIRDLVNSENENMAFSFPGTNKGFTKGRVEYNRPLKLDLRTIGQHIDKVLLFSHMEPAVRDVNKLLTRKGVSYSLGRIDPTIYAGMLTPWLNRSARQIVETPIVGDGGVSRVLSAARSRAGMALMFANVSNTLQQVTGFAGAMAKLKADGLQSHMMRSTAQFIAHPKQMAKAVADASPYMADRMANEMSAINDAMDKILLDPNLYRQAQAWTRKHSYFLQSAFDNTTGPIIWTAAYNAQLVKSGDEKAAVRYADGVIRQTQGSTMPEDVSRIETGPAYARAFTQFIGYFNMIANTNATALKQIAQETGLKKGAGKALMVVTLGMLTPIWVAEAIAVAMKGGPDDKDKDGYLDDWLAAVFGMGTIKGSLAMVPFVGQLANAAVNRFNGNPADDKMSLSPAVSLLESAVGVPVDVYKAITDPDKLNRRNAVRDVASAISIATGLPAYALARPLGYLAGVDEGKIKPTGPVDAVRGAVTGTVSPGSK